MRLKKLRLIPVLIVILIIGSSIFAYGDEIELPKPTRNFYVYDEGNVITEDVSRQIITTNEELFSKTGAQVVLAVINSLEGRDIEDYSNMLLREWEIGSADKNNGVLMLLALEERLFRIEVGYGLEGALPDGKTGAISDNEIIPYFQEGDYSQGFFRGFNAIIDVVEDEYNVELQSQTGDIRFRQDYRQDQDTSTGDNGGPFQSIKRILIVIGIVIFLFIDFKFFGGWLTLMLLRSFSRGGFRGGGGSGGNRGGGGSSGGGGSTRGW